MTADEWKLHDSLPATARQFYEMAVEQGFDDAFGRAIYAANRRANAGGYHNSVRALMNAKPTTAERWREHWLRGGAIKSLTKVRRGYEVQYLTGYTAPTTTPGRRAISLNGLSA